MVRLRAGMIFIIGIARFGLWVTVVAAAFLGFFMGRAFYLAYLAAPYSYTRGDEMLGGIIGAAIGFAVASVGVGLAAAVFEIHRLLRAMHERGDGLGAPRAAVDGPPAEPSLRPALHADPAGPRRR